MKITDLLKQPEGRRLEFKKLGIIDQWGNGLQLKMMNLLSFKDRTKFRVKFIKPFLELELIAMTLPEIPSSPNQKYSTTQIGKDLLKSKAD